MPTVETLQKTRGGIKTLHTLAALAALAIVADHADSAVPHLAPTPGDEVMITDIDNGTDFTFRPILGLAADGVNTVIQTAASDLGAWVRSTFKQLPIFTDFAYQMAALDPEQPLTIRITEVGAFVPGSLYGVAPSNTALPAGLSVTSVRAESADTLVVTLRNVSNATIPATELLLNCYLVANYTPALTVTMGAAEDGATEVTVEGNEPDTDIEISTETV